MFYDLEDPNRFIKDAADSLHKNGIFVAQLMCLKSMIEKNDLGNICHEHIEFYSLKSLKFLFEKFLPIKSSPEKIHPEKFFESEKF